MDPVQVKYSGKQAAKYVQFAEKSYSWKFIERPSLERHLKPVLKNSFRALDAGCGTGRTLKLLLDLGLQEKNLIGVDVSPEMLRLARESFPDTRLIQADLANLRLPPKSLDLVVSDMVFHYLSGEDFKRTIESTSKWLVRGGYLLFIVVHPLRFASNYMAYFSDEPGIEKTPWGTKIEYYPKRFSDYIDTVLDSGFVLLRVEEPAPRGKEAQENKKEYKKYSSAPTRLLIKATKK